MQVAGLHRACPSATLYKVKDYLIVIVLFIIAEMSEFVKMCFIVGNFFRLDLYIAADTRAFQIHCQFCNNQPVRVIFLCKFSYALMKVVKQ